MEKKKKTKIKGELDKEEKEDCIGDWDIVRTNVSNTINARGSYHRGSYQRLCE